MIILRWNLKERIIEELSYVSEWGCKFVVFIHGLHKFWHERRKGITFVTMKKSIIAYGIALAFLVFLLKMLEYRYILRDLSLEFYMGLVAVFFVMLGAWVGSRLTTAKKILVPVPAGDFRLNENNLKKTGISKREYEVLELMSRGNSNQEIADKLFVSLNTIKTHSSNLFVKLDVKRRTQAVRRAKELQLIP